MAAQKETTKEQFGNYTLDSSLIITMDLTLEINHPKGRNGRVTMEEWTKANTVSIREDIEICG